MLPDVVVDAAIADQLPGAIAWAERHRVALTSLFPERRVVRAVLLQNGSGEEFFLQAEFEDYPALPPIWTWCDASWSATGSVALSPQGQTTPFGSSMFMVHSGNATICAPFNRLAFASDGGPHSDWGAPAQWITAGGRHVCARTIGDMLNAIHRDFQHTRRRMS